MMDGSIVRGKGGPTAYVNQVGTAVPPNDVHQAFIDFAGNSLTDPHAARLFQRMSRRSGILHRYSHLQPGPANAPCLDTTGFYRRGAFPGTARRMVAYERHATGLAIQALQALGPAYRDATHLVTASCTGFSAPGLDQLIVEQLDLGGSLHRTMIGFMGCYAAVPALRAASDIVRADPSSRVLVVNLELCTLHLQESQNLETLLSFLVFGDAASAALVTADPEGIALEGFHSVTIPDTRDLITWRIGDQGFDMHLSGKVPATIAAALRAERNRNDGEGILQGAAIADINHWAVHAGGRTVLDAVQQGLDLPPAALAHSRSVLESVGNVSSATLPFVLARILAEPAPGRGIAMAFGPGMAAETIRFSLA